MHLQTQPDAKGWVTWAEGPGKVNPEVLSFIKAQPKALRVHDALDEKFPVEIKHSERSWERVSKIHALPLPIHLKTECFRGIVGLDLAVAFVKTLDATNLPVTVEHVLEGNAATLKRVKAQATYQPMRIDLLTATVENLISYLEDASVSAVEMENTLKFIELLPEDLSSKALAHLAKLDGWLTVFKNSPIVRAKQGCYAALQKSVFKPRRRSGKPYQIETKAAILRQLIDFTSENANYP